MTILIFNDMIFTFYFSLLHPDKSKRSFFDFLILTLVFKKHIKSFAWNASKSELLKIFQNSLTRYISQKS